MEKICVIMPSYLSHYKGSASNKLIKFFRAVNSFLHQNYKEKYLVIVSDGCKDTNVAYEKVYEMFNNIHLVKLETQPLFSGNVRQSGIDYANEYIKPDIFCGLDTDDFLFPFHLGIIANNMKDNDFIYGDEYYLLKDGQCGYEGSSQCGFEKGRLAYGKHTVELKKDVAGTSSVAWKNKPEFSWEECDGWGHDWKFISEKLIKNSDKYSKIDNMGYVICHINGLFDN